MTNWESRHEKILQFMTTKLNDCLLLQTWSQTMLSLSVQNCCLEMWLRHLDNNCGCLKHSQN